jgi:hypothetical protein
MMNTATKPPANPLLTWLRIEPRPSPLRTLAAAPFVVLAIYLVFRGWLYPFWPDTIGALGHPFTADPGLDGAWGGPTLVGAWFVHAGIAAGLQVVCLLTIRAFHAPAK